MLLIHFQYRRLSLCILYGFLLYNNILRVTADYKCICNNGGFEKKIFKYPNNESNVVGDVASGTCKAEHTITSQKWFSILYQHQVGYIQNDKDISVQKCAGVPRPEDDLTTTSSQPVFVSTPSEAAMVTPVQSSLLYFQENTIVPSKPTLVTKTVTAQSASTDSTETSTTRIFKTTYPTVAMSTTDVLKNFTDAVATTLPVFLRTITRTMTENETTAVMRTEVVYPSTVETRVTENETTAVMRTDVVSPSTIEATVTENETTAVMRTEVVSPSTIETTLTENITTAVIPTVATSFSTVTTTVTKALTTAVKPCTVKTTATPSTSVFSLLNITDIPNSTGKEQTTSLSMLQTDSPSTKLNTVTDQDHVNTYTPQQTVTLSPTSIESTTTTTHSHTTYYPGLTELCPSQVKSDAAQHRNIKLAKYENKCYEVVQNKVSWITAENYCQKRRGHLADIGSQDEQDFLYHFLEIIKSHTVWLGLHDLNKEENFQWSSGKAVTYTNWIADRKDIFYHNQHDCVYMTVNGTWDDISCGSDDWSHYYLHAYVCQYGTVSGPQLVG